MDMHKDSIRYRKSDIYTIRMLRTPTSYSDIERW